MIAALLNPLGLIATAVLLMMIALAASPGARLETSLARHHDC
jgi:hypothetical protein